MSLPVLRTKRLTLRPPVPEDAEAFVVALNDPEVHRWLDAIPVPYGREDALWFIKEIQEGRILAWVIEAEGRLCGVTGEVAFGYWLARAAWGKGYATEAGQAVLDHLFQADPSLGQITSGHYEDNARSRHVLEKLGFEDAGPKSFQRRSVPHEAHGRAMVLTRATWAARRAMCFRTERLTLRSLEASDAPAFAALGRHPEVAPMLMSMSLDWSEAEAAEMIAASRFNGALGFRVAICREGALVGTAGVGPDSIMYAIHPDHWGQGYATEAVAALLDEVDARLAPAQLEADHFVDNPASGAVLRKLGFLPVREEMGSSRARPEPAPVLCYRRARWASHVPLQLGDLTLRPRTEADVAAAHAMVSHWDVTRQLGRWPWPAELEVTRSKMLAKVAGEGMVWAIARGERFLGSVGLVNAELGYMLAPEFHGQGVMSRAAAAAVRWGFARYDWPAITATCWEDNLASAGLLHKLGFKETHQSVERSYPREKDVGLRHFRLLRGGANA